MYKSAFQWGIEPLRKYARFTGRAPRAEYWWFYLLTMSANGFGNTVNRVLGTYYVSGVIALALLLPWLAVGVRRLHDTARSGWWLALPIGAIPVLFFLSVRHNDARRAGIEPSDWLKVGVVVAAVVVVASFVLLVWFCSRGTDGPIRYGDDPLDPTNPFVEVFS